MGSLIPKPNFIDLKIHSITSHQRLIKNKRLKKHNIRALIPKALRGPIWAFADFGQGPIY